jgi:serine/threonine protein kinase
VPKIEDIDHMSNQEFSFIQNANVEGNKNYNKLKEILLGEHPENINNNININLTSINSNIKKLILEIIIKCLCYNRLKRISIDEMINQIDYLYDRYIKEKPMKIDAMNIINKDNLMQLNAPIINISLNPYKSKKNNLSSFNSNSYNNSFNEENINESENYNINSDMIKNYDSFISDRYSSVINNNNDLLEDKFQNINNKNKQNFNKNFSKFGSLSSISSNKNYNNNNNKAYLTSITTNNYGHNFSNISEQSIYTNTEINKKLKENEDAEYAKLQKQLDEMVDYINNMNI